VVDIKIKVRKKIFEYSNSGLGKEMTCSFCLRKSNIPVNINEKRKRREEESGGGKRKKRRKRRKESK
jgi:hypothetical protein